MVRSRLRTKAIDVKKVQIMIKTIAIGLVFIG